MNGTVEEAEMRMIESLENALELAKKRQLKNLVVYSFDNDTKEYSIQILGMFEVDDVSAILSSIDAAGLATFETIEPEESTPTLLVGRDN